MMRVTLIVLFSAVFCVAPGELPAQADEKQFILWDPDIPAPTAKEIPLLKDVEIISVKKREPEKDGYDWLHGAAIIRHEGMFFASYGHNKGKENTSAEVNQGQRSTDGGKTWSQVEMIGPSTEKDGRSHGVFLSYQGKLWIFLGRVGNYGHHRHMRVDARLKTEAFLLNEQTDKWQSQGVVADRFWPLDEPVKMDNGNWIMGGMITATGLWAPPGVAVSHGDDLTKWDTIKIPMPKGMKIWGETTIIVEPDKILAIVRAWPGYQHALASLSKDFGRTWTTIRESNLPMTTSKPYAGHLSTGQRYLICTTNRDHGGKRWPLTIAVSRPGEKLFCRMWRIRDGKMPGETKNSSLSYPYAVEYDGKLYVIYSENKIGGNRNNCELAIIPVKALTRIIHRPHQ